MRNIITFIEKKLKLKVNAEKTHITRPNNLKYLGFTFWQSKEEEWKTAPHKDSFVKLFLKLKKLVKRSWSISLTDRIKKINEVLRGWINYYKQSSMKKKMYELGCWLRNAIRVVIWKQRKLPDTRKVALIKLDLSENEAKCVSYSRKGYQHLSHCRSMHKAIA